MNFAFLIATFLFIQSSIVTFAKPTTKVYRADMVRVASCYTNELQEEGQLDEEDDWDQDGEQQTDFYFNVVEQKYFWSQNQDRGFAPAKDPKLNLVKNELMLVAQFPIFGKTPEVIFRISGIQGRSAKSLKRPTLVTTSKGEGSKEKELKKNSPETFCDFFGY